MKIVAVTSCIAGIAHTYMAAEALEQSAKKSGYEIHVETQGAAGSSPLAASTIAEADVVIFAADLEVKDKARFAGKPTLAVGVSEALAKAPAVIQQAVDLAAATPATTAPAASGAGAGAAAGAGAGAAAGAAGAAGAGAAAGGAAATSGGPALATKVPKGAGVGTRIRQYLMTGVSYMIPFVAAGGLLIALSFIIGGYEITKVDPQQIIGSFNPLSGHDWAGLMFLIGAATFGFLVPVLSGFIAFAIADRPGIAPGIVGGAIALTVGAGFLGGLVSGFVAGFIALGISRIKLPAAFRSLMPVIIIPLFATFATGIVMFVILGAPLKAVSTGLASWLNGLSGGNLILLGILLGLMMAFDMGGPVNKVAYAFATTGLASVPLDGDPNSVQFKIMAIVMAAGMTPPLGLALATVIRKKLFTVAERENGKAAWVLGASFITEGAIPFAAVDPIRVIPSLMIGSGVTGALVAAFGSTLRAPHGGIWVTPLVGEPLLYLLAVLIGTVVTALLVILAKNIKRSKVQPIDSLEDDYARETAAVNA